MKINWWNDLNVFELTEIIDFNLQRFASAESEGRTEKATEHKKRKAREEGRVALSKELPAALITLFTFIAIYFLSNYIFKIIMETFVFFFENFDKLNILDDKILFDFFLIPFMKIFIPIAVTAFVTAILSNYMQIGFQITFKSIKPKFSKISPNIIKFLKNQVFSVTGFFNFIKSIVKIAIIGIAAYITISSNIEELKDLLFVDGIINSTIFISKLFFDIVFKALIILIIFSIFDILFVKWQYEESLKMKKEEVKEEYKELYGDPNVRMRLRQMYQSLISQKKMLEEVPKADVVITNPTHFAVALYYDKYIDDAPRVKAKGKDRFAQKIKEIAKINNIFMYENIDLARKLYDEVEVNQVIPRTMYSLVIIAYKLAMEHKERKVAV